MTEQTQEAVDSYIAAANKKPWEFLFGGRRGPDRPITTRQYARLVYNDILRKIGSALPRGALPLDGGGLRWGWCRRSMTDKIRGIRREEFFLFAVMSRRFIFVFGLANGLKSTGFACREPRRLSGCHPHPALPHQGGGLYYFAYVRLFARHYTSKPVDCGHWSGPEVLRDALTSPNQSDPHLPSH
jgi:hypothetical protein